MVSKQTRGANEENNSRGSASRRFCSLFNALGCSGLFVPIEDTLFATLGRGNIATYLGTETSVAELASS